MKYYLVFILVFGTIDIICDLLCQRYCAKKCKFDCSECRNWRCYKHWCDKEREKKLDEIEKKLKKATIIVDGEVVTIIEKGDSKNENNNDKI